MKKMKRTTLQKMIVIGSIFLLFGTSFFGTIQLGIVKTTTGSWFTWQLPITHAIGDDSPGKNESNTAIRSALSQSKVFQPLSLFLAPNGKVFTINFDAQNKIYSFDKNEVDFTSKSELLLYILDNNLSTDGTISQDYVNILPQDNPRLAIAIEMAERQVSLLKGRSTGAVCIERPFFEKKVEEVVKEEAPIVSEHETLPTKIVPPVVVKVPPTTPVKKPTPPTNTPATTPTKTPVTSAPQKDVCVKGDYTGNLYDGSCGTKPKDSCSNGDYTGNLYDGSCGTKPKDSCPKGDFTGDLYDGSCGTKPKDVCTNGDYTGNLYDGACGSKPKDKCVKDYSGSLYDGECGTKPKPDTNTSAS